MRHVPTMSTFKREYFMIRVRLLMEKSYLKQYMGGLGKMPAVVARLFGSKSWLELDHALALERP